MNNTLHSKVFITDDHPIVVEGLRFALTNTGEFQVVGSANAASQMYDLLPKVRPHLLMLDINLPGTDFYTNIKWVRDQAPWVKVLVFSEYYSEELVRSLFQEGISAFVSKTVELTEIIQALKRVQGGEAVVLEPVQQKIPEASNAELYFEDGFKKRLSLSRREQQILTLISRGLSSQRIGKTLFISKHTVETHRKNILRKLDFNTSTELVKFAVQHGLV